MSTCSDSPSVHCRYVFVCVCVCLHACNTHTGPFLVLCLSEPGGVGRGKGVYHLMTVLLYDIGERKGKKKYVGVCFLFYVCDAWLTFYPAGCAISVTNTCVRVCVCVCLWWSRQRNTFLSFLFFSTCDSIVSFTTVTVNHTDTHTCSIVQVWRWYDSRVLVCVPVCVRACVSLPSVELWTQCQILSLKLKEWATDVEYSTRSWPASKIFCNYLTI